MDQKDEEALNAEFVSRAESLNIAPGPEGPDVKEWMKDGVEELFGFFNITADIWDSKFGVEPDNPFYLAVASQVPETTEPIEILDLGCGTGIQLDFVFARAPNARITAVDLAPKMLEQLKLKFSEKRDQLAMVQGSLIDLNFEEMKYDHAVSVLTMHHLHPEKKVPVYRKVRKALKPNGTYTEADQSSSKEGEENTLYWFQRWISKLPGGDRGEWNYDITLSVKTQKKLLGEAGFSDITVLWENPGQTAVLTAASGE